MRVILLFLVTTTCIVTSTYSQIPSGYYSAAENLSDQSLKSALHNIIDDHEYFNYSSETRDKLKESDVDPNNGNNIILIYTRESVSGDNHSGWNREHVWAKSRGDFENKYPEHSDLHNLRASNISVNSTRINYSFDECENNCQQTFGNKYNGSALIFEPRDEDKGDVARIIFYMDVRYEGDNGELDLEMTDEIYSISSKLPRHGVRSTLLQWHTLDPVDDFERNRNNVIYSYQGNRNPFIDHPELVDYLWGDNRDNQWSSSLSVSLDREDEVFIPNPIKTEYLTLESDINYTQIELIDMQGKVIRQLSGYVNRIQMPTSTGIYFLNLKYDNKVIIKKLIVNSI